MFNVEGLPDTYYSKPFYQVFDVLSSGSEIYFLIRTEEKGWEYIGSYNFRPH